MTGTLPQLSLGGHLGCWINKPESAEYPPKDQLKPIPTTMEEGTNKNQHMHNPNDQFEATLGDETLAYAMEEEEGEIDMRMNSSVGDETLIKSGKEQEEGVESSVPLMNQSMDTPSEGESDNFQLDQEAIENMGEITDTDTEEKPRGGPTHSSPKRLLRPRNNEQNKYKQMAAGKPAPETCTQCEDKQKEITKVKATNTKLKTTIIELSSKVARTNMELKTANKNLKEALKSMKTNEESKTKIDEQKVEIDKLNQEVKNLKEENRKQEKQMKTSEEIKTKLDEQKLENNKLNQEVKNLKEEYRKQGKQLEEMKQNNKEGKRPGEKSPPQKTKQVVKELEAKMKEEREKCKQKDEEIELLQTMNETLQERIQNQDTMSNNEKEKLKEENRKMREENLKLKEEANEGQKRKGHSEEKIRILGDSNTKRFIDALKKQNPKKTIELSMTYTTEEMLEYVNKNGQELRNNMVIISTGTNDFRNETEPRRITRKVERALDNIDRATQILERNRIKYAIVQLPPNNVSTDLYQETICMNRELLKHHKNKVIKNNKIYETRDPENNPVWYLEADNYHLNNDGGEIMAKVIDEGLKQKATEIHPQKTEKTVETNIEQEIAGRLVGREGQRIKTVANRHGVMIRTIRNEEGGVTFIITGQPDRVEEAKEEIAENANTARENVRFSQQRSESYKTKICANYQKRDGCPYGRNCWFIHEEAPAETSILTQDYDYEQHRSRERTERRDRSAERSKKRHRHENDEDQWDNERRHDTRRVRYRENSTDRSRGDRRGHSQSPFYYYHY